MNYLVLVLMNVFHLAVIAGYTLKTSTSLGLHYILNPTPLTHAGLNPIDISILYISIFIQLDLQNRNMSVKDLVKILSTIPLIELKYVIIFLFILVMNWLTKFLLVMVIHWILFQEMFLLSLL